MAATKKCICIFIESYFMKQARCTILKQSLNPIHDQITFPNILQDPQNIYTGHDTRLKNVIY